MPPRRRGPDARVVPVAEASVPPAETAGVADPAAGYRIVFLLVVTAATAALAFTILQPFLAAIAWAVVLAVSLQGLWRPVARALGPRRGLAAGLMATLTALVVLLPAALLASVLFDQATQAARFLSEELRRRHFTSLGDVFVHPWVSSSFAWIQARTGVTPEAIRNGVADIATAASAFVAAKSGGFVLGFLDALLTFVTTIVLLFFLLRDGDHMAAAIGDLLPIAPAERRRIMDALGAMLQSIFRGSLLCALVQGVSGGLGWALAGLGSPVLAGALTAVCSLVPLVGTAAVWLPGALWAWIDGRPGTAVFLLLWGAVVTSFIADNLLRPLLVRGGGELSTLVVFLGVFGGMAAFGLLGIFIGPIALAVASMVLEVLRAASRAGRPPETAGAA